MRNDSRVVTANIPANLAKDLDVVAKSIERSRSWIVREALHLWLGEQQRRHEMTLEALASVDAGRTISQEEIERRGEERRRLRAAGK